MPKAVSRDRTSLLAHLEGKGDSLGRGEPAKGCQLSLLGGG